MIDNYRFPIMTNPVPENRHGVRNCSVHFVFTVRGMGVRASAVYRKTVFQSGRETGLCVYTSIQK